MSTQLRSILLIGANLLIPIAILTFASGFFPYKPFLPGLARYHDEFDGDQPFAPFDKVIFMVVDALRRYAFLKDCSWWTGWLTISAILSIPMNLASNSLKGLQFREVSQ